MRCYKTCHKNGGDMMIHCHTAFIPITHICDFFAPGENTCNVWTLARANLFLSLERNLLTLTAEDPNGYFGFLNSNTGDVFLRMAPLC